MLMRVSIIKKNNIENFDLPKRIYGNYWIKDYDKNGEQRNLINIEAIDNKWYIKRNFEVDIKYNNTSVEKIELYDYTFYTLNIKGEEIEVLLYCSPVYDLTFTNYQIINTNELNIGKKNNNHLIYNKDIAPDYCAKLIKQNNRWYVKSIEKATIYVNKKNTTQTVLKNGDNIFIYGLKIIIMNDFIIINNPNRLISYQPNYLKQITTATELDNNDKLESIDDLLAYEKDDYFYKSPRFRAEIENTTITIDPPPTKEKENDMPMIYTIGPMITMGMTSIVTGYSAISNVAKGSENIGKSLPTIIMSLAMISTMIMWPILLQNYEKRKKRKNEKIRQEKYSKYIDEKRKFIENTILKQKQILIENSTSLKECESIIINKKRNLWERNIEHSDFLNVRIGTGVAKPSIDIKYPEEHFTMDDDNLNQYLNNLINESKDMVDCPINVSLIEKKITAVVGNDELTKKFLDSIILQIITFHGYDDVKIVLLTDENSKDKWEYIKNLPHNWNETKTIRYYGNNSEDVKQITNNLGEELKNRIDYFTEFDNLNYMSFNPYYVIIIDSLKIVRTNEFVKKILEQKENLGFSVLIKNDKLSNLPNECTTFINIDKQTSGIFENELVSDKQKEFVANIDEVDMNTCAICLSRIPIETKNSKMLLPNSVSFLEMYNVGMIEQLNILNRWKKNNPTISLEAPVGIAENGDLFKLDLHEKYAGPHGLVAGMTGSGKSEFIITYILSMAINFHPNEVQFVLIDYKGGGLAGAFENRETGVKLPHLVGTITNLDTAEMNRSLASIQSELKRRQKIFNEARDKLNESTVDIYKYQRFYREGKVDKPVAHLFIISDEFAELKVQQPDFMEQLISTARIGRSLGVHLILATQKPSGVVDDQIWSNSKFRVCLKVQEKSDSMDMIKCPDAASLKNVGRFYLQVGYNEIFALGQSAWAGAQYYKTEKMKKKIDTSINFIDNIGNIIKSIDEENKKSNVQSSGEELPNIVNFLFNLGKSENIHTEKLWLDSIPQFIKVNDLKTKYNYIANKFNINPIIGEYDIPCRQQQSLLTLPISDNGNSIIYGSAGSGKELLMSTIIYSTIIYHSTEEVKFYILDFGSESLKMYLQAPQVGDVITSIDEEKIKNLFKMIYSIIEERKQLFVEYNGNYDTYCQHSGKTVPTIIIMINQYESFLELYEDQEEIITKLSREGLKYGVIFIISVSGVNNVRYKFLQNFKQSIVLQLNDESDYSTILGNTQGLYPTKIKGRGLIKIDDIYEFQTASIVEPEQLSDYIKDICSKLRENSQLIAESIPVLPKIVNFEFIEKNLNTLDNVPVGIEKDTLKIISYDFKNKYTTLVTSEDINNTIYFVKELITCLTKIINKNLLIIDAENLYEDEKYYSENLDNVFQQISNYISKLNKIYVDNNYNEKVLEQYPHTCCIIIGINTFLSKISEENKNQFERVLEKAREIKKISFIVVDNIANIKENEFKTWFSDNFSTNQGIWVGDGIDSQYTIKLTKNPKNLKELLSNNFGYIIKNGYPQQVKLLTSEEIEDDI